MLIGVFELLAESRRQIGIVRSAIDANEQFWMSDAALQATLIGNPTMVAVGAGGAATLGSVSTFAMAALPEPVIQNDSSTMDPLVPNTGRPYNPVITPNGWTCPWRMNNNVKEFHLVAEPVVREMSPVDPVHSCTTLMPMRWFRWQWA